MEPRRHDPGDHPGRGRRLGGGVGLAAQARHLTGSRRPALALGIAALTLAVQNGIVMAFAVLYVPLVDEFRGSRGDVAMVQSAVLLLGGFGGPLIGWAFDRLGPRRLFQGGAVLGAAAFLAASRAESLPALVLLYGVVGGLALSALGSQANMVVAALWYPHARGRAIAVADLGTGFGAFCFIPLAQALVVAAGWRGALVAWAALLVGLVVPLNGFQRLPGAGRAAGAAVPGAAPAGPAPAAWTVAGAVRSPAFWWLGAMRFFAACAFPLMNTHMVVYAIDHGIATGTAAAALGAVSLVSLPGRLATGWLCDRIGRAQTLTVTYASAALGVGCLAMLAAGGSPLWLGLYVLFYGLAQGSSGIVGSARAADVFAGASFATIYGWLALAVGPGEALGAWAGGVIFDATGSYLPAFGLAVAALAAGLVAMWRVRPDPARGAARQR